MRRGIWITVLAIVAFAVIVIARLPAGWVVPDSPGQIACGEVDGTIWSGTCGGLVAQGAHVGDVVWNVHAFRLLLGKLSANVVLTRPNGSLSGDFDVGLDKSVSARDVQASLPLDRDILTLLPPNLRTLQGTVSANIVSAHVANGIVQRIEGTLEFHNLQSQDRDGLTDFGSYALTFPPATGSGDPTGVLKDTGGPLAVDGTVRLLQDKPGFDLEGYVTPRGNASPALQNQLQYLGSPDAQGRRQFGTQMTF